MKNKKYIRGFAVSMMVLITALQIPMNHFKIYNTMFRICITMFIMFGSMAIYEYSRGDEVMDHLVDYYRGDEHKAKKRFEELKATRPLYIVYSIIMLLLSIFAIRVR